MKKFEFTFGVLKLPIDLISIVLAFSLAYFLRMKVEIPQTTVYMWSFDQYFKFMLIFLPFWALIFALEGLYNIKKPKGGLGELSSIFLGVSTGIALMVVWIFFSRFLFFSRLIIVYAWILTIVLVYLDRYLLKSFQRFLYKRGIGLHRVIVIGACELAKNVAIQIRENPRLGFRLVKMVDKEAIEKLDKILAKNKFEEIIIADPSFSDRETNRILEFCEDKKIGFKMIPSLLKVKTTNVEVGSLSSYPMLEFKRTPLEGWGKVAKRFIDIIVSLIGLIVVSPLFLIVALIIKLDSKGSIFFRHKRIGSGGREFNLHKFRSMIEGAPSMYEKLAKDKNNGLFANKIKEDPRITKFGKFLRATCIDELPQLFNVLRGEMSLVGPRPLTPEEFKRVAAFEKKYSWTSYIRPGITGLWQVSGRIELSDLERLSLDIYYVENWSLILDFWALFKTPLELIRNRGNY